VSTRQLEGQDDGVFETLRAITMLRNTGIITEAHYRNGFRMLNSTTSKRCACGTTPALVSLPDGGPAICAACWEARR